jgi:DNA-binding beta-propeller fold protein YncE
MRRVVPNIPLLAMSLILVACASNIDNHAGQENGVSPQWPPAPQAARVSYLYSVTTPTDAKIGRGFLSKTWRFIKGAEPDRLSKPQGIHVDSAGRLYVVDAGQGKVHVFDPGSSRYFSFPDEPITDFEYPVGITADGNGRVYVSDSSTNLVHVFDSFGKKYLTSIGAGQLLRPTGLALRPDFNELLVVDTLASEIIVFDTGNFNVKQRAGHSGQERDALHYPTNIALAPDGDIYITDALNFRIQILSADLGFEDQFGEAGDSPGFFSRPKGVAVDSDHNIYVVDALFDNIQVFNRSGLLLLAFGTSGHAAGEFWLPNDIVIDSNDRIYISDSYNSRVQIFQYRSVGRQP